MDTLTALLRKYAIVTDDKSSHCILTDTQAKKAFKEYITTKLDKLEESYGDDEIACCLCETWRCILYEILKEI